MSFPTPVPESTSPARIATSPSQLGAVLRARRLELGLTQQQAARRANLLQKTVSAVERQTSGRSLDTIFALLNALDLEIAVSPKPGSAGAAGPSDDPDAW